MVRVTLASANAADIHLHYQVRGPSWGPSYRARLNTETATVELERLALVAQTTGEDWRGVALTLSDRPAAGRQPRATAAPLDAGCAPTAHGAGRNEHGQRPHGGPVGTSASAAQSRQRRAPPPAQL